MIVVVVAVVVVVESYSFLRIIIVEVCGSEPVYFLIVLPAPNAMFSKKPSFLLSFTSLPKPCCFIVSDFWSPVLVKQQFPIILKTYECCIFRNCSFG